MRLVLHLVKVVQSDMSEVVGQTAYDDDEEKKIGETVLQWPAARLCNPVTREGEDLGNEEEDDVPPVEMITTTAVATFSSRHPG